MSPLWAGALGVGALGAGLLTVVASRLRREAEACRAMTRRLQRVTAVPVRVRRPHDRAATAGTEAPLR